MNITFDPPFLPIHTALATVAVAGAALLLYLWRDLPRKTPAAYGLTALRAAFVLALALILLNPVVVEGRQKPRGKAPFVILLDTSRSMSTRDEGASSRFDAARALSIENRALLDPLSAQYELRYFQFDEKTAAASADALRRLGKPAGPRTSVGAGLAGVPSALGAAAKGGQILLVSDGRDTSDSFPMDAARAAKAQGLTLHTLCVGRQTAQRDLQVVPRKSQVFVAPGQTVQVGAEIRDTGVPRSTVQVSLLRDGRKVSSQSVIVEPGRREVSFPVMHPQKGLFRYAVAVEGVPEEQNQANNRANVFVNVMNTRARVLFLDGRPSWDSKFLAQALRADPTVSLDVIYKLTDTKFFAVLGNEEKEAGVQLPRTTEQFAKYDVVIFGKGFEEFYDDRTLAPLKSWVSERGGSILFLRGRADERTVGLREIEPLDWSEEEVDDLRLRLTQEGKAHPGFAFAVSEDAQTVVRKLPSLISSSRVKGEKALAVVLARADAAGGDEGAREMTTLAYSRYGQGKVMAVVGQGLWRWAFLPPDLEQYGKVYEEFWSQTIRWMVSESDFLPGQNVTVRADKSSYAPGDTVNFLGFVRGGKAVIPPAITLTLPDGKTARVGTARSTGGSADFTAAYRVKDAGEYVVAVAPTGERSAPVSAMFTVLPGQEEDLNRSADPDLMRQIAAVGGGLSLSPSDISKLPERLKAAEQGMDRKVEPRSAWDRPWVLALLLSALGLEWWLRRRAGLT